MHPTAAALTAQVREAGYALVRIEQLRSNRWLLTVRDAEGAQRLVLAQCRPLISSADVHDLAELLRLRRVGGGFLLAIGGSFSPEARRAAAEQRSHQIFLCNQLPARNGPPQGLPALETA